MNWLGAGCPLCGGGKEYRWGSNLPCGKCQRGYQKVLKYLPEGTSIDVWYAAREKAEKILAQGGTEEKAQEAMRKEIVDSLKARQELWEMARRRLVSKPENSCADHLFEGLNFN